MSGTASDPNVASLVLEAAPIRYVAVSKWDSKVPFLSVLGTVDVNMGVCKFCGARGRVSDVCRHCCRAAGIEMVMCTECQDEGPYGLPCQWCCKADYGIEPVKEESNEPIPEGAYDMVYPTEGQTKGGDSQMGSCPLCNQEGVRGCLCSGCEGRSILYG